MRTFMGAALLLVSVAVHGQDGDCVDIVDVLAPNDVAGTTSPKAQPRYKEETKSERRARLNKLKADLEREPTAMEIELSDMGQRSSKLGGPNWDRDPNVRPVGEAERVMTLHKSNEESLKFVAREYRKVMDGRTHTNSCAERAARQGLGLALGLAKHTAVAASQYSAQYGLYTGPNFSLGGAGEWQPGVETLARFDTEAFTERDPGYSVLKPLVTEDGWLRGYTEISYQSINALEATEDTASGTVPADSAFASATGYARINTGVQLHLTGWYGFQAGLGMSSLPNAESVTRMEPRYFGGLHFQTLYADGAVGQFFVGAAYDKFWQREVFNTPGDPLSGTRVEDSFGRFNFDGLLFVPGQALNFHLAARVFADAPLNGEGPSDLRVSILVYTDFSDWLNTFLPIRNVKSVTDTLVDTGL